MRTVEIDSDRSYTVYIGADYLQQIALSSAGRKKIAVIFSQAMSAQVHGSLDHHDEIHAEVHYFQIPDGEEGKSRETLHKLWDWLAAAGFSREDLIIGIGGGAVTDISGFAAATWLRGIDWIAVPTTVAGMVDAAIGGKTGINSAYGKNLIGSFYSPIAVIIDLAWLPTLSDRDFAAGLAEVAKSGFIVDPTILDLMEGKVLAEIRGDQHLVLDLITKSVQVKASVVSRDFKESFDREVLNYGHTFAHAVEQLSKYTLRHGECVSIGLVFIAELSLELGIISKELRDRHRLILSSVGLPMTAVGYQWQDLYALMQRDKKNRGAGLRFVIITQEGRTERLENPDLQALTNAFERVSK